MKPSQIKILKHVFKVSLSLLFPALIILLLLIPLVNADQKTNVNITVAQKSSAEIAFSINPTIAYQNQDIDFVITLQNTGNIAISAQPEIKIYRGSALIANLTSTPASIPVSGSATFILTWNAVAGDYKATANVYYDNETINATKSFSIVKPHVSHSNEDWQPEGDALGYVKFPVLAEARPGEALELDAVMKSSTGSNYTNLKIKISGTAEGWIDASPDSIDIAPNSTTAFRLYTSIPSNASPGDYKVALSLSNAVVEVNNFFILRVKPYPPGYQVPTVTRIVTVDMEKQIAQVHLKITNHGELVKRLELIESISKSIASGMEQIQFETSAEILESDPLVKWVLNDLEKGETRMISYTINGVLDEYFPYVYWPVKQVNVFYEKPEIIRIAYKSPESLAPNETGEIQLNITNLDKKTVNITAKIEPPTGWAVSPAEITTTIPGNSTSIIIFSVTPPSDAGSDQYNLKLRVTYDSGEIIENISILVQPGLSLFYIILALLSVILMGGALYLKRRENQHKNNNDNYERP